jgi:hypothetical protein
MVTGYLVPKRRQEYRSAKSGFHSTDASIANLTVHCCASLSVRLGRDRFAPVRIDRFTEGGGPS